MYTVIPQGLHAGIALAIAIGLHNIPEGMAVAAPILHATGDKWQAFKWSLYSGLCEPIGGLVIGTLFWNWLNDTVVLYMVAGVAGMMVYISIKEIMPASLEHVSPSVFSIGVMIGMLVMAISIQLLNMYEKVPA